MSGLRGKASRRGSSRPQSTLSESLDSQAEDTKSVNAYNPDFQSQLDLRRIFDVSGEAQSPKNIDNIEAMLRAARRSEGPSDDKIDRSLRRLYKPSKNEAKVTHEVIPCIMPMEEIADNEMLAHEYDKQFKAWDVVEPLSADSPRLTTPQPDLAIGFHSRNFDAASLQSFGGNARPCGYPLAFPVFFVECKGKGDMDIARFQNLQNGAYAGQNLRNVYQRHNRLAEFYDIAHVMSVESNGKYVVLGCHWVCLDEGNQHTYYAKVLRSWAITDPRRGSFREARECLRNVVLDWTRTQLNTLKALVNQCPRTLRPDSAKQISTNAPNQQTEPDSASDVPTSSHCPASHIPTPPLSSQNYDLQHVSAAARGPAPLESNRDASRLGEPDDTQAAEAIQDRLAPPLINNGDLSSWTLDYHQSITPEDNRRTESQASGKRSTDADALYGTRAISSVIRRLKIRRREDGSERKRLHRKGGRTNQDENTIWAWAKVLENEPSVRFLAMAFQLTSNNLR